MSCRLLPAVIAMVLCCTSLLAQSSGLVMTTSGELAYAANDPPYRAYASLTGRADDPSRVHTDLFAPIIATHDDLLFADVRGQFLYGGGAEGNLGLAYRHMFGGSHIAGVYGFYDVKESKNENTFNQATLGVECLSDVWEMRWNGYLPEGGSAQAANATAVISAGNLVVQNNVERAYFGTDAEIGVLLWRLPTWCDTELRGFAGGFHFDTNSPAATSIAGPRLRAEVRSFDLPFLAMDSRLTVGLQYQHDNVRESQTSATFGVRMPFGFDRNRRRKMTRMERRMTDAIVRDVDVVSEVTPVPGGKEMAQHAKYDFEIGSVTVVDARTEDLQTVVANATTDSVIINGTYGEIRLSDPIEVQDGQQLLGGGLPVKGAVTGVEAIFGSPVRLVGTDPARAVILTADHSVISGFDIHGGLHGISSDLPGGLDNLVDVLIFSNNVTGADDSGFRFGELDIDSVIAHNRATGNGGHGFDVELNEGEFVQNNALGNEGNGFDLFDNHGTVSLNRSLRNEGFGFFADDNSGDFNYNESYENELSGFDFLDNNGSIVGNLSADNGLQGYTFAANNDLVEDNWAFDNGSLGFDFDDNNGTIQDNLAFDNGDVGFDFADNYGDFLDNVASGNGLYGFSFNDNFGNFLRNGADSNDDTGFDFVENAIGGTFSDNVANDNGSFGYDGVNNGTANNNTGSGNGDGGNTFP
ncbi:right-handed parallel beta-helix repeat-containing protein [Rhodopirellula halodulae]|uniref:right-handed parallel beta-helix repeat-containing protein n=1 Tax=Rhodopirellula halodulae TaxID=2894198 RepID=UPI001E4566BB|nr:right-handed parallel beta-helix repeat-containing protein [Rhodopirellula sp. JC737]MCC9655747.1 right-handed parallel beta-helix repeat-containing protein [Rhodopirellula sp. JC737]